MKAVFDKNMKIPFDYSFDEDFVLWKGDIPIRKIASSNFIENELLASGFKIKSLYFHHELAQDPFENSSNYSHEHLPKILRVAMSL